MQGDLKTAGLNTARLTTIGILGIFDVAAQMGVVKDYQKKITQTLGKWGTGRMLL